MSQKMARRRERSLVGFNYRIRYLRMLKESLLIVNIGDWKISFCGRRNDYSPIGEHVDSSAASYSNDIRAFSYMHIEVQ